MAIVNLHMPDVVMETVITNDVPRVGERIFFKDSKTIYVVESVARSFHRSCIAGDPAKPGVIEVYLEIERD